MWNCTRRKSGGVSLQLWYIGFKWRLVWNHAATPASASSCNCSAAAATLAADFCTSHDRTNSAFWLVRRTALNSRRCPLASWPSWSFLTAPSPQVNRVYLVFGDFFLCLRICGFVSATNRHWTKSNDCSKHTYWGLMKLWHIKVVV